MSGCFHFFLNELNKKVRLTNDRNYLVLWLVFDILGVLKRFLNVTWRKALADDVIGNCCREAAFIWLIRQM